jgi:hypothetical protein
LRDHSDDLDDPVLGETGERLQRRNGERGSAKEESALC